MSRLDDLIDLIQTTNEVYFITAPGRVRTAYILADDITELALKTYLQMRVFQHRANCQADLEAAGIASTDRHFTALRRYFEEEIEFVDLCNSLGLNNLPARTTLQNRLVNFEPLRHWSANNAENRRTYDDIIVEVRSFLSQAGVATGSSIWKLLSDALERHKTRNKFYHDHRMSNLTIDDDKCLRALCDLFSLMELLFTDFLDTIRLQQNKVIRCQIGVLRLKLASHGDDELKSPYYQALKQLSRNRVVEEWSANFEHTIVHTVTEDFFIALKERLDNAIAQLQARVRRIDGMAHPNVSQTTERTTKVRLITILTKQLDDINNLLSTP